MHQTKVGLCSEVVNQNCIVMLGDELLGHLNDDPTTGIGVGLC